LLTFERNYFYSQGFTLCGGMSWLRSTPAVIEFVKHLATRCGCGNESFIDCKCRCDDQQVLNSIALGENSEYKIVWDRDNVTIPNTWDEQSWDSVTGTCQKTGHRVKVWDRHTAYRGIIDPNRCPRKNWISMPSAMNDKKAMVERWDVACGPGRGNNSWALSQPAFPVELVEEAMVSSEPWYQRLYNATSVQGKNTTFATTTKIVVFADESSLNSAVLWYRRLQSMGYTSTSDVVVVSYDSSTATFLSLEGIPNEPIGLFAEPQCPLNPSFRPLKQKQMYHRHQYAARWHYILRQLVSGKHILTTDAASGMTIHRHLAMSQLEVSEFDAYHAFSGGVPSFPSHYFWRFGFTLCSGMSWFRSTPSVIDFVREIASQCNCAEEILHCRCLCNDQQVLNRIMLENDSGYRILWDRTAVQQLSQGPPKSFEDQSWHGMSGVCNKTGHRVQVWDRHTVYHGFLDNLPMDNATGGRQCPQHNWIALLAGADQNWDTFCSNQGGSAVTIA
jgi:hypothetical protein